MIAAALVAYQVVYLCYRNLKSWDVFRAPQDDMLLRWDRWLFFGHSPAVLLHDLLGEDLAARLLTDLYESFSTLVTIALVAALAFTPTVRSAYVFVVSAMWAWILGVGSYYLIPSLGPFHAAPAEFSGLTRTSIQRTQEAYVVQRDHLLAEPTRARRVRPDLGVREPALRPDLPGLPDGALLRAASAVVGGRTVPGRHFARHGVPRLALRGRRHRGSGHRLGLGAARKADRAGFVEFQTSSAASL